MENRNWVTPNTSEVSRANREVGGNRMGQGAKKKYFLPATSVSVSTLWEPHIVGALVKASKKRLKNYLMRPGGGHCHDQNTTEKRTSQETGSIRCEEP